MKNGAKNVGDNINTNHSVLGQDLLDWIVQDKSTKTEEQQIISNKLYHKYVVDRDDKPKNKIYPNVYYYVNYNNNFQESVYLAYIVRDKVKSPRKIPETLAKLNIMESLDSYKGSLIQEWAYFQNGSAEREFYMEGCEIVTHYLEGAHPLRPNVYYHVTKTNKGIKIFRDLDRSPRFSEKPLED